MYFYTCRIVTIWVLVGLITQACKPKDDSHVPPTLQLKGDDQFTQSGDTIAVGRSISFGFEAQGQHAVLTNLVIEKVLPDGSYSVVLDSGMYAPQLNLNKIFYQSIEEVVHWTIRVMDQNRLTSEVSLTVYKDPNSQFGGIRDYPSVTMGYQNNSTYGQFYNLETDSVYTETLAGIEPDSIDLLTYYIVDEGLPSPVFSSPGEYDHYSTEAGLYYPSIKNWNKRNYVLWDISVDDDPMDASAFDQCHNDSLIIVGYHDVWGKKKFKWATEGRVIPFQNHNGKRGLIKVLRADHDPAGSIEFALKMQL